MNVRKGPKYCAQPTGVVEGSGGPFISWHTSGFDGSEQPYSMYVPSGYDASRGWPLVISLHGHSADHVLNMRRVLGRGNAPDEPDCRAKMCFPKMPDVDFLIASPYGFGSIWYDGPAERDVLDVLADVRSKYNVDPDRIFLTGLSMGGEGTWSLATRYPHLFAAIAPVCPPMDHRLHAVGRGPVLDFEQQVYDAYTPYHHLRNLIHVPMKVFHGDADPTVPVDHSRKMVERARELGCHVRYVEYPGVGHNAWDPAYEDGAIFHWFKLLKRIERPATVEFATPSLRWPRSYWLRIDQIEARPGNAVIRADAVGDRTIKIITDNVAAFTILLDEAPVDRSECLRVVLNSEEIYHGVPTLSELSFGEVETGLIKRAGLEGPVPDAFRDRYLLVYGSNNDHTGVYEASRELVSAMADPDEWADIHIPVKSDVEVSDEDLRTYNIILFGNPATNSLIRRVNDDLPVRFAEGGIVSGRRHIPTDDAGLLVVYPNPICQDRYVVIIGGNTPETLKTAAFYRYAPDYVIFEPGRDDQDRPRVLDSGTFSNRWGIGNRG